MERVLESEIIEKYKDRAQEEDLNLADIENLVRYVFIILLIYIKDTKLFK